MGDINEANRLPILCHLRASRTSEHYHFDKPEESHQKGLHFKDLDAQY